MNSKIWNDADQLLHHGTVQELKSFFTSQDVNFPKNVTKMNLVYMMREWMNKFEKQHNLTNKVSDNVAKKSTMKKGSVKKTKTSDRAPITIAPENYTIKELKAWLENNAMSFNPNSKLSKKNYIDLIYHVRNRKHIHQNEMNNGMNSRMNNEIRENKNGLPEISPLQPISFRTPNPQESTINTFSREKTFWPSYYWTKEEIKTWLLDRNVFLDMEDHPIEFYLKKFDDYQYNHIYIVAFFGFDRKTEDEYIKMLGKQDKINIRVVKPQGYKDIDFGIYDLTASDKVSIRSYLRYPTGILITWERFMSRVLEL